MQVRTIRLLISGRVQGVGFREALQREAERLSLRGWVRNRRSGEVEALVQGPAQAVAALQDWAHRGPPAARVLRVECGAPAREDARNYARFERWPSA